MVWAATEWSKDPVTPSAVARRLGLKLSTVSGTFTKLTAIGLTRRSDAGSILLTDLGRKHALAMVRRHRLLETFLLEKLGYPLEKVHAEAENLEHVASDYLIERIADLLGRPNRDPHGDPIPDDSGRLPEDPTATARRLRDVPDGDYRVERISDVDPDLIAFFSEIGITPGSPLRVSKGDNVSGRLLVATRAGRSLVLDLQAADSVWVSARGND